MAQAPFISDAFHAKNSRLIVGPEGAKTTVKASDQNASTKLDPGDLSNFESGGVPEYIGGFASADWDIAGVWRGGIEGINSDPPGFYVRDDLRGLVMYTRHGTGMSPGGPSTSTSVGLGSNTEGANFNWAFVSDGDMKMSAKDTVKVTARGTNNGPFTVNGNRYGPADDTGRSVSGVLS